MLLVLSLSILIATQSIQFTAIILLIGALLLLALITPLSAFAIMLILAPLRTLIATESPIQLPLDIGQISFVVLIGFWGVQQYIRKRSVVQLKITPISLALLLFIVATGLSIFTAASISTWLNEWLKWVIIIVLMYLTNNAGKSNRWHWILFLLTLSGVGNAIVGIYIFLGGSGADHLLINNRFFRAFGTFGQPNPFGGFLGLLAPLALMAWYGYVRRLFVSKTKINKAHLIPVLYYGIAFLILSLGLFASWSRGAWLGFISSIAIMAFSLPHKVWQSLIFAGVIIVLVSTLWFSGVLPQSVVDRVVNSTEEFFAFDDVRGVDITSANFAVVERLAHWQAALNMAQYNPWFGVGFGNYEVVYLEFQLINWDEPLGHAHNYYLNILAEAGIIGFFAYLILLLGIMRTTWQIRKNPDNLRRAIGIGLIGTWTYLSIHSLLDNLYVNNIFLHLGTLLGLLAILYTDTIESVKLETR